MLVYNLFVQKKMQKMKEKYFPVNKKGLNLPGTKISGVPKLQTQNQTFGRKIGENVWESI